MGAKIEDAAGQAEPEQAGCESQLGGREQAECDGQPGCLGLAAQIKQYFGEPAQDIRRYSPLTLAYIGDSIYDLVIRTLLVGKGNAPVNALHHQASAVVKAEAQKESLYRMEPLLTEEERSVYRRGRNAKSYTTAKNASVVDYRIATGLEALMGYLYLSGQTERLLYLIKAGLGEGLV